MATEKTRRRPASKRTLPRVSDVSEKGDGAGQARAIFELKVEHVIILQALEDANRSLGRAVLVSEIADEISERDKRRLEKAYSNDLGNITSKTLGLLAARGLVSSPGTVGRRRFYFSVGVLDSESTGKPSIESRRSRALGLVRDAVQKLGRAVRCVDLLEHIKSNESVGEFKASDVVHDLLSLAETGELSVVGSVRGEGKGRNLYLPSDMEADEYMPKRPLTWLDEVARTVESLWAERIEEAKSKGRRPKPLTTGDIRERVVSSPFHTQREINKNPQIIVDAVKHLTQTGDPLLRKIKRHGQKALLWVPVDVDDESVDLGGAYAHDAERMGVAVKRAVDRLGRPVTVRDITDEIDKDLSLQPVGASSIHAALADTAKATVGVGDGQGRRKRVTLHCHRIGRAGRDAYYYTSDAPEARAYVSFRQLELRWSAARLEEHLEALDMLSLPWVTKGRAMLVLKEAEIYQGDFAGLLANQDLDGLTRKEARELQDHVDRVAEGVRRWLAADHAVNLRVPADVATDVPGWTAEELLQAVKPLYPHAQTITDTARFIRVMHGCIRRVPNPLFESRFSQEPRLALEFFYDRTDALLYICESVVEKTDKQEIE